MEINKLIDDLIVEASYLEVSDIHFQPIENEVQIYYRVVDKLIFQKNINIDIYSKILRYIKFKSRLDISKVKNFQDGSFLIKNSEKKYFIRISVIPLLGGESLVIRILSDNNNYNIEEIASNKDDIYEMREVINKQIGLFIFTGPTGSGKTTTMYSILNDIIEKEHIKVITIENPIEIINEKFIQVQIDEELKIDYSSTLKAVLRHDPDIIMIGEIRDEETARNVFRAALTGHTVISTMHTKNIYGVVQRFLEFGFLQSEIESILIGICNQRLILSNANQIKSVYDYAINQRLEKILKKEIKDEGIEKKIKQVKIQNTKI